MIVVVDIAGVRACAVQAEAVGRWAFLEVSIGRRDAAAGSRPIGARAFSSSSECWPHSPPRPASPSRSNFERRRARLASDRTPGRPWRPSTRRHRLPSLRTHGVRRVLTITHVLGSDRHAVGRWTATILRIGATAISSDVIDRDRALVVGEPIRRSAAKGSHRPIHTGNHRGQGAVPGRDHHPEPRPRQPRTKQFVLPRR